MVPEPKLGVEEEEEVEVGAEAVAEAEAEAEAEAVIEPEAKGETEEIIVERVKMVVALQKKESNLQRKAEENVIEENIKYILKYF